MGVTQLSGDREVPQGCQRREIRLEVGGHTEGWVHPGRLMCQSLVYGQQSFSGQESLDLLDPTVVDVSPEFESSARGDDRIQYLDGACPE